MECLQFHRVFAISMDSLLLRNLSSSFGGRVLSYPPSSIHDLNLRRDISMESRSLFGPGTHISVADVAP